MPTRVVNVRNLCGPAEDAVCYVGRPCRGWKGHALANPFRLPARATQAERRDCLTRYAAWLDALPGRDDLLRTLKRVAAGREAKGRVTPHARGCWVVDLILNKE